MTIIATAHRARPIHPAAKARAAKFGCEIIEDGAGFRLVQTATGTRSQDLFDKVAEATEELAHSGIEGVTWEKPAAKANRSGCMVLGYHKRYSNNPEGPGCNDQIDVALRDYCLVQHEGAKVATLDLDRLREVMLPTGLFREEWMRLNPGMIRMNSANRLRGWLRNNADAEVVIDGIRGRFGVLPAAPKEKKTKAPKEA